VVQSPELGDQTFSGSQALSPIDDSDVNFDETTDGGPSFSSEADQSFSSFDDSIEISADDISLELGDIMPIDLDQLDEPIDLDNDTNFDSTEVLAMDRGQGEDFNDDIDLNLTGDLFNQTNDFDSTEVLSSDSFGEDIDLNMTDDFDEKIKLDLSGDLGDFEFDSTSIAFESLSDSQAIKDNTTLSLNDDLDLDDDLLANMTGELPEMEPDIADQTADFLLADLQAEAAEEPPLPALSGEVDTDLDEFEFDETDLSLEPEEATAPFSVDDTLSEIDSLDLDNDPRATLTGAFPTPEIDATEETSDFLRADPQAETAGEQPETTLSVDTAADLDEFKFAETDLALEPETTGEQPEAAQSADTAADLDEFKFAETDLAPAPEPIAARETFNSEDTLTESVSFAMDDELDLDFNEFDAGQQPQDDAALADELFATMDDELDLDLNELDAGPGPEELGVNAELEELEPESEGEIFASDRAPSLGLDEIDVSDLLAAPAEEESPFSTEDEAIDLTSLLDEDEEGHDSDLDLLAEDMPKFELIDDDEDNDEGPPDLPR
jgi:hypothetical protein